MTPADRPGHRAPDIEFRATVSARELRFRDEPETDVRFHGDPGVDGTSEDRRRNLPDRVRPGRTYRDIQVDYRLAAALAGDERGSRRPRRDQPPT